LKEERQCGRIVHGQDGAETGSNPDAAILTKNGWRNEERDRDGEIVQR
jgi:hypothetical protein